MRVRIGIVAAGAAAMLAACAPGIGDLNLRPERHYQQKLTLEGRIARRQDVPGETLLELADERERRILVTVRGTVEQPIGTWVEVTGVLVPEASVGGQSVYDVIAAESVSEASPPWFPNLF